MLFLAKRLDFCRFYAIIENNINNYLDMYKDSFQNYFNKSEPGQQNKIKKYEQPGIIQEKNLKESSDKTGIQKEMSLAGERLKNQNINGDEESIRKSEKAAKFLANLVLAIEKAKIDVANTKEKLEKIKNEQDYIEEHDTYTLRSHQLEAFEKVKEFIESGGKKGYLELPTGYGKTVFFIELIEALGLKTIVVAPTGTIIQQTLDKALDHAPQYFGWHQFSLLNEKHGEFVDSETGKNKEIKNWEILCKKGVDNLTDNDWVELVGVKNWQDEQNKEVLKKELKAALDIKSESMKGKKGSYKDIGVVDGDVSPEKRNEAFQKQITIISYDSFVNYFGSFSQEDVEKIEGEIIKIEEEKNILIKELKDIYEEIISLVNSIKENTTLQIKLSRSKKIRELNREMQDLLENIVNKYDFEEKYKKVKDFNLVDISAVNSFLNKLISSLKKEKKEMISKIKSGSKAEINPEDYDLVILDEAHRGLSDLRKATLKNFLNSLVFGFTATKEFGDKNDRKVSDILENEIVSVSTKEGIEKGYISPVRYAQFKTGIETGKVGMNKMGEYDKDEYEKEIDDEKRNEMVVEDIYEKNFYNDSALVFCRDISHAQAMASKFEEKGISAASISSNDPKEKQMKIKNDFKSGKIKVLCSNKLLAEGFDATNVSLIINTYITTSKVVEAQRVGRGLRLDQNDKNKIAYVVQLVDEDSRFTDTDNRFYHKPVFFNETIGGDICMPEDTKRKEIYLENENVTKRNFMLENPSSYISSEAPNQPVLEESKTKETTVSIILDKFGKTDEGIVSLETKEVKGENVNIGENKNLWLEEEKELSKQMDNRLFLNLEEERFIKIVEKFQKLLKDVDFDEYEDYPIKDLTLDQRKILLDVVRNLYGYVPHDLDINLIRDKLEIRLKKFNYEHKTDFYLDKNLEIDKLTSSV